MTEQQLKAQFSSQKNDWETPQDFFDYYDSLYHFTLDAASSDENAKCEKHFTIADDGLHNNWGGVQSMVKPSVWQRDWKMGAESLGRVAETRNHGCLPFTSKNRYRLVSRLLPEGKDNVHPWSVTVLRSSLECAISFNGCCVRRRIVEKPQELSCGSFIFVMLT